MKTEKTSTILFRALKKLNNGKNWFKGNFSNGRGHYCVMGAIGAASGYKGKRLNEEFSYFMDPAVSSLKISLGHGEVAKFNDSPDTKFSDVKRVLKAAIKRERANGN